MSRVLDRGDVGTVAAYVAGVVAVYDSEYERFEKLLVEREPAAWEELHDAAYRIAYSYLRKNLSGRAHHALREDAQRVAGEAIISVLNGDYHYDIGFDRWFAVVVFNQSLKELDRRIVPRNDEIEVDAYENWLENMEQIRQGNDPRTIELRHDLRKAIACLPSTLHRRVIALRYFAGLTPAEIAERLGRSTNSIYKAHHYALKNLRDLLADGDGDDNEPE